MSLCEQALRRYFAVFDGTPKDFSEVEPLYDALYHDKFEFIHKVYNKDHDLNLTDKYGYEKGPREQEKKMHAEYLSKGTTVTIVHIRSIGVNCLDVEFNIKNEEEERTVRVIYSIEDDKIATARDVESFSSIVRAKFASDVRLFGVFGKYGTNM